MRRRRLSPFHRFPHLTLFSTLSFVCLSSKFSSISSIDSSNNSRTSHPSSSSEFRSSISPGVVVLPSITTQKQATSNIVAHTEQQQQQQQHHQQWQVVIRRCSRVSSSTRCWEQSFVDELVDTIFSQTASGRRPTPPPRPPQQQRPHHHRRCRRRRRVASLVLAHLFHFFEVEAHFISTNTRRDAARLALSSNSSNSRVIVIHIWRRRCQKQRDSHHSDAQRWSHKQRLATRRPWTSTSSSINHASHSQEKLRFNPSSAIHLR